MAGKDHRCPEIVGGLDDFFHGWAHGFLNLIPWNGDGDHCGGQGHGLDDGGFVNHCLLGFGLRVNGEALSAGRFHR